MNGRDVLVGVGLGALMAFVADPSNGRRRRALVRDQLVRATAKSRAAADATARDVANRTTGAVAEALGRWRDDHVEDDRLVERVRARLGRVCSHPRAIDVSASNREVTLRGHILAHELDRVLKGVHGVRGVTHVVDELDTHETGEGVPSLQGEGHVPRRGWTPASQVIVAAAAIAGTGVCLAARSGRPDQFPPARSVSAPAE